MNQAQIAMLQDEQAMVQQQLRNLSAAGNSMSRYSGRYGGRYARYAQNPIRQFQQQLRARQNALSQQLNMARKQVDPAKQKEAHPAVRDARERAARVIGRGT